jgi:hypothetical protein
MRDQHEIEHEMFEAKQDLAENLDQVVHRAREKIEVRARAVHAAEEVIRKYPLQITFGIVGGMVLFGLLRRI